MAPDYEPDLPESPLLGSGPKFWVAMLCYAVLAALAGLTTDGSIRLVVWILLGGLAVKTYLAKLQKP